jgi:hypothetical protein
MDHLPREHMVNPVNVGFLLATKAGGENRPAQSMVLRLQSPPFTDLARNYMERPALRVHW